MKAWSFENGSGDFVKNATQERVKIAALQEYERDNHEMLRGVKGEDWLEMCLSSMASGVSAEEDTTPKGDPLVELHTEPDAVVEGTFGFCMVCGHLPHDGECQIV